MTLNLLASISPAFSQGRWGKPETLHSIIFNEVNVPFLAALGDAFECLEPIVLVFPSKVNHTLAYRIGTQ